MAGPQKTAAHTYTHTPHTHVHTHKILDISLIFQNPPPSGKAEGKKSPGTPKDIYSFFHFGGCEMSSGQGTNKISPVTAHLAEFKWTLHSVHRFIFKFHCALFQLLGSPVCSWQSSEALTQIWCQEAADCQALQFWVQSSTVWKAIPVQIRWKQSQTTPGWYLCARGRFLRQKWLLNSFFHFSLN